MGSPSRVAIGLAILLVVILAVIFVLRRNQKDLSELQRQQKQEDLKTVLGDEED